MCELGFSPFFRERSFKSRQNPRVDFFSGKERLRRIQNGIFPFTVAEFWGRWIVLSYCLLLLLLKNGLKRIKTDSPSFVSLLFVVCGLPLEELDLTHEPILII